MFFDFFNELPVLFHISLGFVLSFLIVFLGIPIVLRVARMKNIYDEPNHRSAHKIKIPTLGGVAIFIGFFISISIFLNPASFINFQYLTGAMAIIAVIGIKDDILVTSPSFKLIAQIFAALLLILFADLRITNFQGFLGIYDVPYIASFIVSLLLILALTNAFNLIDGIDGLTGGVSLVVSIFFGIWFTLARQYQYAIIAFTLTGSLVAFLYYNALCKTNKIFMGDTGAMLIGLVTAFLVIQFLELNITDVYSNKLMSAPAFAFGVLIVPLWDTLRIILVRLGKNRSPFNPDKNHIHHRLLKLGFSHIEISLCLMIITTGFIILCFVLDFIGNNYLFLAVTMLALVLSAIPSYLLYRRKKRLSYNARHKLQ